MRLVMMFDKGFYRGEVLRSLSQLLTHEEDQVQSVRSLNEVGLRPAIPDQQVLGPGRAVLKLGDQRAMRCQVLVWQCMHL